MRIAVNAPMARDKIIRLLTEYRENGMEFRHIETVGLKVVFEASGADGQQTVSLVKKLIRETDFGKVLYFSVVEA